MATTTSTHQPGGWLENILPVFEDQAIAALLTFAGLTIRLQRTPLLDQIDPNADPGLIEMEHDAANTAVRLPLLAQNALAVAGELHKAITARTDIRPLVDEWVAINVQIGVDAIELDAARRALAEANPAVAEIFEHAHRRLEALESSLHPRC